MDPNQAFLKQVADEHLSRGDVLGWFERIYAEAGGDASRIPWAQLKPRPHFVEWCRRAGLEGRGRRALAVGCGLGDDAVELARLGFEVTAFDVSPTAVEWSRRRFPSAPVRFLAADLFAPPGDWARAFAFVFEAHTVQALPRTHHANALRQIAGFVAPAGTLLLLARGRDETEDPNGPPWPLARSELEALTAAGLREDSFEDLLDPGPPALRRFRAAYRRPGLTV